MIAIACLKCWMIWLMTGSRPMRPAIAAPMPAISTAPFMAQVMCGRPFIQIGPNGPSCLVGATPECAPNPEGQRLLERLVEGCRRGLGGSGKPCLGGVILHPKERKLEAICTEPGRETDAR